MQNKFFTAFIFLLFANLVMGVDSIIPNDSKIGTIQENSQKILLNPMEQNSVLHKGGWHMTDLSAEPATIQPKVGSVALALQGVADIKGGKGDFTLSNNIPGVCNYLGAWVYLDEKSNIFKLGFQIHDSEGEAMLALFPANWKGWKWLEIEINENNFKQAYKQASKNSKPDQPLKSVHFVFFSNSKGVSSCIVDGLSAATIINQDTTTPFLATISKNVWGESNTTFKTDVFLSNFTNKPVSCTINYSIQEDSSLYNSKAPDPLLGKDHALKAKSWVEVDGEKINNNFITDGENSTSYGTPYKKEHYSDAFQFIDLGQERNIKKIDFKSGDANWCWGMDVLASPNGKVYTPVPDLQKINMHKKWGIFTIGPQKPFKARFLKLHFKARDGKRANVIRMPASIMIYDGADDENMDIPKVGNEIEKGTKAVTIPAKSFAVVSLLSTKILPTGGYFIGLQATYGDITQVFYKNYFVMPESLENVTAVSRFGINASTPELAKLHKRMGMGWIRFENMKWAFISPEKGKYAFDGSVKPWGVNEDEIIKNYTTKYKLNYLPYVFQTPRWASSAPEKHRNFRGFPPKNYNDYGTCIFQIVARYGSKKHPKNKLLTNDKLSGMNLMKVIELWNEPNLNAESWGPWVGSIEKYFDIFRIGAEAAKKADPNITVTSCGWAGISLDVIGKMATYKYPDGKTPLDFTDILNVHFYSGKADPECAVVDRNVQRGAKPKAGSRTYEEDLRDLVSWWKKIKPGKPIWLTETGYDVGGPIGRDERYQAAKLPRCTMMAFAAGIEKVFVYREKGSTPTQHAGAGFLRNDKSIRPSWFAFATLIRQLHGVKTNKVFSLHFQGNKNIWGYLWDKDGKKVFSVWALDDKSKLPLDLGQCTVTDSFGLKKKINVNGNLKLSIFPVYITDISNIKPLSKLVRIAEKNEKVRVAKQKKLASLKKYLFDFGSREFIGVLKGFGPTKNFTTVLSNEIYDKRKKYGFTPKALDNEVKKWISDLKEKDGVKVRHQEFIFKAKPGKYKLEVGAVPFAKSEKITIKGIVGGEITLDITKLNSKISQNIEVNRKPISISFGNYTSLRWITLIEKK